MRIQYLSGGLGNEIREYIFARYMERRHPESPVFFDDSWFFMYPEADPEVLEPIFGMKLNLLSRYFDPKTWSEMMWWKRSGVNLPQILLNMGIPMASVKCYTKGHRFDGITIGCNGFFPELVEQPYTNVYYDSYWIEDEWFLADAEENRSELVFPQLKDPVNLAYEAQIQRGQSVGIHVRRGDFLPLGWGVPNGEYKESCQRVLEAYPNARFFVFSDDLDWCMKNERELGFNLAGSTVYVEGNTGERGYIDMQLLSKCDGIIRPARSSFSQVAALLNPNLKFEQKLGEADS